MTVTTISANLLEMRRLLASCLGLGWLPVAPGTWGSIPPTIVFGLMSYLDAPPLSTIITMAILALAGGIVCVVFAPASIRATGKSDPSEVVADEFSGQAVTFLAAHLLVPGSRCTRETVAITVAGFLLFRFFDILKPWPIRRLEKLPRGWGILADDLLAGIYAAIALAAAYKVWSLI